MPAKRGAKRRLSNVSGKNKKTKGTVVRREDDAVFGDEAIKEAAKNPASFRAGILEEYAVKDERGVGFTLTWTPVELRACTRMPTPDGEAFALLPAALQKMGIVRLDDIEDEFAANFKERGWDQGQRAMFLPHFGDNEEQFAGMKRAEVAIHFVCVMRSEIVCVCAGGCVCQ